MVQQRNQRLQAEGLTQETKTTSANLATTMGLLLNLADADLTHCLPDSRIIVRAELGGVWSAGPSAAGE